MCYEWSEAASAFSEGICRLVGGLSHAVLQLAACVSWHSVRALTGKLLISSPTGEQNAVVDANEIKA